MHPSTLLRRLGAAEIRSFQFWIFYQAGRDSGTYDLTGLEHVAAGGNRQRQRCHLIDQQDGDPLVAQLGKVGTFDAGGLYGPIQLGAEVTNGCEIAMTVVSGKWKRLAPSKGFLC